MQFIQKNNVAWRGGCHSVMNHALKYGYNTAVCGYSVLAIYGYFTFVSFCVFLATVLRREAAGVHNV